MQMSGLLTYELSCCCQSGRRRWGLSSATTPRHVCPLLLLSQILLCSFYDLLLGNFCMNVLHFYIQIWIQPVYIHAKASQSDLKFWVTVLLHHPSELQVTGCWLMFSFRFSWFTVELLVPSITAGCPGPEAAKRPRPSHCRSPRLASWMLTWVRPRSELNIYWINDNIILVSVCSYLITGRWYIREGWLKVVPHKGAEAKPKMFFLFSDMLLQAKHCSPLHPTNGHKFAGEHAYPLQDCAVEKVFGYTRSQGGLLSVSVCC